MNDHEQCTSSEFVTVHVNYWSQVCLPTRLGGFGLRALAPHAAVPHIVAFSMAECLFDMQMD